MHLITSFLLFLLTSGTSAWGGSTYSYSAKNPRRIRLSDVSTLTLAAGKMTSHRRVPAIPQLRCASSHSLCALASVDAMRCRNVGSGYDDEDIQWTCTAELPEDLRLGRTDVTCEGYDSADDPYVLKGSCGVEYTVHLTDKGRTKHPDLDDGSGPKFGETWASILFAVVFIGISLWIVGSICYQCLRNRQYNNIHNLRRDRPMRMGGGGFWGGGGGGGGGGSGGWGGSGWGPGSGNDDPPPPYSGPKLYGSPQQRQGWRPGFWSGLAGGAAAGYFAGQRNNQRDNWGGSYRYSDRGNGPWGYERDRYDYGGQRHNYGSTWGRRSGSRSSEGSSTGATHESTGFGSTNRR